MKLTVILKKHDAEGLGGEILENMGMTRSTVDDQVFSSYHLIPDLAAIQVGDVEDSMFAARVTEALMDNRIRPLRVFQRTNSNAGLTNLSGGVEIESENEDDDDFSVEDALFGAGVDDGFSVQEAMRAAGLVGAGRIPKIAKANRINKTLSRRGTSVKVRARDEGPTVDEALAVLEFNADDLLKDAGFLTTDERGTASVAPAAPASPVVTEIQQAKALVAKAVRSAKKISAGYAHYWNPLRDFTDQEWKKILRGAKAIIRNATAQGIALTNGSGNGKPMLTPEYISLNGKGSDGYEGFSLNKQALTEFDFTKTNERPYDGVVVSILALAKKVASDAIGISSDGGAGVFKHPPFSTARAKRGTAPPKGKKPRRTKTLPYSSSGGNDKVGKYTLSPARYAKGKVMVSAPSMNQLATPVSHIAQEFGKYTNRGRGFIMSPAAAKKFEKAVAAL